MSGLTVGIALNRTLAQGAASTSISVEQSKPGGSTTMRVGRIARSGTSRRLRTLRSRGHRLCEGGNA
jgi:hypothetical protein